MGLKRRGAVPGDLEKSTDLMGCEGWRRGPLVNSKKGGLGVFLAKSQVPALTQHSLPFPAFVGFLFVCVCKSREAWLLSKASMCLCVAITKGNQTKGGGCAAAPPDTPDLLCLPDHPQHCRLSSAPSAQGC